MSRVDEILEKNLDGDFSVFAAGDDAPSALAVMDYERLVGYSLPNDFKEYSMSGMGGIYIAVKEEIWPRPQKYSVGPFWSFLYGMMVFSLSSKAPEWMDMRIQTKKFNELNSENLAPFLKIIGDANVYCFDKNGIVVRWDHEANEAQPVGKTFIETFAFEVESLRKRKDRKLAETKLT